MRKYKHILFLIVLLGFLARFIGSWYGHPFFLGNFDETISMRQVMAFGATKSLRPLTFLYPTFYFYFLSAISALGYLFGKIMGWFPAPADFVFLYLTRPFNLYFLARLVSVIFGTLTVLITCQIGRRVYNARVGLWSAGLLAMAGTHIVFSHWAKPDVFMVFLSSASLLFSCFILTDGRLRNYLLAGLFMGLAISAKYNAALLVVSFLTIHFLDNDKKGWGRLILDKRLWAYFLALAIGFILTSPYCVIEPLSCWQGVIHLMDYSHFGEPANITRVSAFWIFVDFLKDNSIIGIIFFTGIIYCLLRPRREHWILLSSIGLSFLIASVGPRLGPYHFLPVFPAMAVTGGLFLDGMASFLYRKGKVWAAGFFLLIALVALGKVFILERSFLSQDSRITSKEWIESNLPSGSRIALYCLRYRDYPPLVALGGEFSSVDYGPRARELYKDSRLNELLERYYAANQTYRIYKLEKAVPDEEVDRELEKIGMAESAYLRRYYRQGWRSLDELKSQGVEYLILSSFLYGLYEGEPSPRQPLYILYGKNKEYFATLMNSPGLLLMKEFKPGYGFGPTIRIYKVLY